MDLFISTQEDFRTIVDFIAPINGIEENQCLHCGENPEQVYQKMMDYHGRKELKFVHMLADGELIGVLGCDGDEVLEQIWFWGPYVKENLDWTAIAEKLYTYFLETTPQAKKLFQFLNVKNEQSRDFYTKKGFKERAYHTILYLLEQDIYQAYEHIGYANIIEMDVSYKDALNALHNISFPDTYYTTEEMLKMHADPDKNKLYIKVDAQQKVLGYILVNVQGSDEGYVHFVAVDSAFRKQKIGISLLQKGIEWLFYERKVDKIFLSVNQHNNAKQLYKKVNFRQIYVGVGSSCLV